MMNERIAQALQVLQDEGVRIKFAPDEIQVDCGRLVAFLPANASSAKIQLDGIPIENMLQSIDIHAEVKDLTTATIRLGVVPGVGKKHEA